MLHALPLLPGRLRPSCDPSSLSPHLCVSPQCTPLLSDFTHMQRSSELTLVTAVGPPAESLQETGNERRVLRLILAHLHHSIYIHVPQAICPLYVPKAAAVQRIVGAIWLGGTQTDAGEHLPIRNQRRCLSFNSGEKPVTLKV